MPALLQPFVSGGFKQSLWKSRNFRLHLTPAIGFALIVLTPELAFSAEDVERSYPSCDRAPTESDISAAQGAYKAGQVSFEESDYERAILYWEDAFRRDCTAIKLLLNIARAYELSSAPKSAASALSTYLDRRPDAEDRVSVEKRIEKLREKIAEETRQAELEQAARIPKSESRPETRPTPAAVDATEPTHERPLWPVFMTGGGVAGMAVGITFGILGHQSVQNEKENIRGRYTASDGTQCSREGRNWDCPSEIRFQVESDLENDESLKNAKFQRNIGIAVAAGSTAVAGAGAVLWYYLWKSKGSDEVTKMPSLVPIATPGFQGLSLSGTF